jgi:hypothetical protein
VQFAEKDKGALEGGKNDAEALLAKERALRAANSALAQKVLERWTSPGKKRQQQQQHQQQTFEHLHVWLAGLSGWLTGRARSQPDPTGAGAPEDEDRVLSSVEHILADIRSRKTPARRSPVWPSPTAHAQTAREFSSSTALVALDDDAITPVRRWTVAGRHVGEVLRGSRTERVYFNDDGSIYYTNHYPIKPELPEYEVLEQGASAAEPGKVIAPKIKHGPRVGFANDYPHATKLIELDPHNAWYKGSPRGPLGIKFSGASEGAGLLEDHATGLAIVEAASATGGGRLPGLRTTPAPPGAPSVRERNHTPPGALAPNHSRTLRPSSSCRFTRPSSRPG